MIIKNSQAQTLNNGFLLVNKPYGPSSHDIIYQLRKITGIKKIGHAGTLDPFASGLLLIAIGEATKVLRHYVGLNKTYEATLKLGAVSNTQDRTGNITRTNSETHFTKAQIQKILKSFIGKQKQIPPMHSAKKIKGQRLYKLARKGKEVKRDAQDIEIYNIKLVSHKIDELKIKCKVSSGTYIRTLAHDIGDKLGCGAYLEELKRTAIGDFKLKDALDIRHSEQSEESRHIMLKHDPRDPSPAAQDDILSHLITMKTVLVSGTFDGIHKGHKNYFQQARKLGHRLFAIVARDSIAEKIKNKKPQLSEKERIKQVKACDEIDRVYLGIIGSDKEIFDFTASIAPDIIALGYDQKAYTENLEKEMIERGLDVEIVRLKPYKPEKYKSSLLGKIVDKKQ